MDRLSGVGPVRITRHRALPHWYRAKGVYFVTYRLAGSLPRAVVARLLRERETYLQSLGGSDGEMLTLQADRWWFGHVEDYLHGTSGVLAEGECASAVRDVLMHHDGTRHDLLAWCVMPNHVHAVVRVREGWTIGAIAQNWKGMSARLVNALKGTRGTVWQKDYFERLVRDEDELWRAARYTLQNPRKAGLRGWKWVGVGRRAVLEELGCEALVDEL